MKILCRTTLLLALTAPFVAHAHPLSGVYVGVNGLTSFEISDKGYCLLNEDGKPHMSGGFSGVKVQQLCYGFEADSKTLTVPNRSMLPSSDPYKYDIQPDGTLKLRSNKGEIFYKRS